MSKLQIETIIRTKINFLLAKLSASDIIEFLQNLY